MSIADQIVKASEGHEGGSSRRYGVDVAKVTNINDPDKLNRVKCQRVTGEKDVGETEWMFVSTPFGGNGYGVYFMPNVGDLVLITYIDGNVHNPVVIGSVWSKEKPAAPYAIKEGKNETFSVKLPSGAELLFSEEGGKEKISLTTKKGHRLLLEDGGEKIELSDDKGKNRISFDLASGAASVEAEKTITLKAGSGASIEMDGSGGKITIKANNAVTVKGAQVSVEASGSLALKGNSDAKLESSGITSVKGSMLKLN